ncbi:MAG: hypothetical protein WBC97_04590 [Gemmatimonadales bacterium]
MTRAVVVLACGALVAAPLAGQGPAPADGHCLLSIDHVSRATHQIPNPDGTSNYFLGGDVRLSCQGTDVRMAADSVAAFNDLKVTYFLGHVRYDDSSIAMTADNGTYLKDGERWEARGNVVTRNTGNGSTLRGPSLDYMRAIAGIRDTAEMYATGRPRVEYVPTDSSGKRQEPYVIYADRVRFRGNDQVFGGGSVTVDRSDLSAKGDSLRLDTGPGQDGGLYARTTSGAEIDGKGSSNFTLTGKRIDLSLTKNELTGIRSTGRAHAVDPDWDLVADTIDLHLKDQHLVATFAWGDSLRPRAVSPGRDIIADSLAIDTPDQVLTQARAFGSAWIGGAVDSVTHQRDQLWGDTVVADFVSRDSAGKKQSVLSRVEARHNARSYHLLASTGTCPGSPVSYIRGGQIVLFFRADENDLDRVVVHDKVDGVQIEPVCAPPDSTHADSLRADSARATPRRKS